MVIFRENTEDIYAGIEFPAGSKEAKELFAWLKERNASKKIRFPESSGLDDHDDHGIFSIVTAHRTVGLGIKPISKEGTQRLVTSAIEYALTEVREQVLMRTYMLVKFSLYFGSL